MRKRISVCLVVAFASMFGAAACGGGGQQQEEIDQLELEVEILEERLEEVERLLGNELAEEPTNDQTTGGGTTVGRLLEIELAEEQTNGQTTGGGTTTQ